MLSGFVAKSEPTACPKSHDPTYIVTYNIKRLLGNKVRCSMNKTFVGGYCVRPRSSYSK